MDLRSNNRKTFTHSHKHIWPSLPALPDDLKDQLRPLWTPRAQDARHQGPLKDANIAMESTTAATPQRRVHHARQSRRRSLHLWQRPTPGPTTSQLALLAYMIQHCNSGDHMWTGPDPSYTNPH